MGDGTNLVVVPARQDAADQDLVGSHLALGGLVDLHHIVVDLLRHNGGSVLGTRCGQNHEEVPLRLHAQVSLDIVLQALAVRLVVCALDGLHVGVGPREENVVEDELLGAGARHGLVQVVHISGEGPTGELDQPIFKPRASLALDVFDKIALEVTVEGISQDLDLERILVRQRSNERLLVGAETLHGAAEGLGIRGAVPLYDLRRAIPRRRGRGRDRGAVLLRRRRSVRTTVLRRRRAVLAWRRCR